MYHTFDSIALLELAAGCRKGYATRFPDGDKDYLYHYKIPRRRRYTQQKTSQAAPVQPTVSAEVGVISNGCIESLSNGCIKKFLRFSARGFDLSLSTSRLALCAATHRRKASTASRRHNRQN
jgi:hypothetical protein